MKMEKKQAISLPLKTSFSSPYQNRFSERLSIGISFKFLYYKLYQGITSSGIGFDIGAIYLINPQLSLSLMISDINSRYQWDSTPLYGQDGVITKDNFPLLKKLGCLQIRRSEDNRLGFEFENSNGGTNIFSRRSRIQSLSGSVLTSRHRSG